jgi:hypothetical protein
MPRIPDGARRSRDSGTSAHERPMIASALRLLSRPLLNKAADGVKTRVRTDRALGMKDARSDYRKVRAGVMMGVYFARH